MVQDGQHCATWQKVATVWHGQEAAWLRQMRVERCRLLLSTTDDPLKLVAAASGFDTSTRMKRAFQRDLGVAPGEYRYLHGAR